SPATTPAPDRTSTSTDPYGARGRTSVDTTVSRVGGATESYCTNRGAIRLNGRYLCRIWKARSPGSAIATLGSAASPAAAPAPGKSVRLSKDIAVLLVAGHPLNAVAGEQATMPHVLGATDDLRVPGPRAAAGVLRRVGVLSGFPHAGRGACRPRGCLTRRIH